VLKITLKSLESTFENTSDFVVDMLTFEAQADNITSNNIKAVK
jgi:hypothetical protein